MHAALRAAASPTLASPAPFVSPGYLPGGAPVAVKLGLKRGAISREAAVLSALSGRVGFPLLLHHEPEGSATPGAFRDTSETLPRHFRDPSETLPRHFRDTSETLPRHL